MNYFESKAWDLAARINAIQSVLRIVAIESAGSASVDVQNSIWAAVYLAEHTTEFANAHAGDMKQIETKSAA